MFRRLGHFESLLANSARTSQGQSRRPQPNYRWVNFTSPLAQAASNSAWEIDPSWLPSACLKLTMNGVAFASGRASPEGAALLQTCWHWSGVNTAEGRPEVIVFVCASRHVAVNGNTKSEISDALSMGSLHTTVPLPRRNN